MRSEPDQSFAPGCFGAALTYSETSPYCVACPYSPKCGPLSAQHTAAARASVAPFLEAKLARQRGKDSVKSAAYRKRKRSEAAAERVCTEPRPPLTREEVHELHRRLQDWLSVSRTPLARRSAAALTGEKVVLERFRRRTGKDPSPTEFANSLELALKLPHSRSQGQKRLALMKKLESAGGPWFNDIVT
jgi:hypothetical protein